MSAGIAPHPEPYDDPADPEGGSFPGAEGRSLRSFAHEQLRALVRQVFFSPGPESVKQVVFTAVDSQSDVAGICQQVGEALSRETEAKIAVVTGGLEGLPELASANSEFSVAKHSSSQAHSRGNLRLLHGRMFREELSPCSYLTMVASDRLCKLRREFEYSIVEAPAAGESSGVAALGRIADGVVLVVAANRTRRAAAKYVKRLLDAAHVRVLGVVLSERTFPVPEGIYQRI